MEPLEWVFTLVFTNELVTQCMSKCTILNHMLIIQVSGIDDKGFRIERQTPTAITRIVPGPPELKIPEVTRGYFGLTAVLVCQVDSLVPYTVQWFKEDVQQGPELYFL